MVIFADRMQAGEELAAALARWRDSDAVVFGIPRGGVVVAAVVAARLDLPLDAVLVRKLGATGHEELAVGAVAEGVRVVSPGILRAVGMTPAQLAQVETKERSELDRRRARFGSGALEPDGRPAIVVDDGIATGATATAACRALRAHGASWIVLATPVAPAAWRPEAADVDQYVCPHVRRSFGAVGQFYDRFEQTDDEEVARLLGD